MTIAFDDLRTPHDRGALFAALSQARLQDEATERLGGEFDYQADLEADVLVFTGQRTGRTIETSVELIASVAPGPGTVVWGRALPAGGRAGAERLVELGRADGLASLTADEVPFPVLGDGAASAAMAAIEISAVVATATGGGITYVVSAGASAAVLLLGALDFAVPRIDHTFPTRVAAALGAGTISDHRAAVHGLAVMSGWTAAWADDWTSVALADPVTGHAAELDFDEYARLANLRASLG